MEVSSNLVDWAPLCTLLRTNSSTNALIYHDAEARHFGARFYRLAATNYVTPYLPPTGPYPVGRLDRMVTDPSRRNRYAVSTNSSFMVSIFYPAVADPGLPLLRFDNEVRGSDPNYWPDWIDRLPWLFTETAGYGRLATNETRYPIVFQSHGVYGAGMDLQNQSENLASHGYVVVAPDHYETWAVLYPDGTYLFGTTEAREGLTVAGMRDRVADLVFLMNQLEQWNQTDPLFADRLNLDAVAGTGFSWGGPTVGEFCRSDARCKAAISLDGGRWDNAPDLSALGLQKPSLMMNSSGNGDETLFSKATKDAVWFQISGAAHLDFTDLLWWPDPNRIFAALEVSRTVHAYQVSFLNKYLKGQDDHLLDGLPGARFPRVVGFKKK